MRKIIFITGGQRSGKSHYAQKLAKDKADNPIFLATARIWDEDFKARVKRHRSDRSENWQTIEEEKTLINLSFKAKRLFLIALPFGSQIYFMTQNTILKIHLRRRNQYGIILFNKTLHLLLLVTSLEWVYILRMKVAESLLICKGG